MENTHAPFNSGREISYKTVTYGMLVEYLLPHGGYSAGVKVHFFNKKGVLVGNYYQFVPYTHIRSRKSDRHGDRTYQRFCFQQQFESAKQKVFVQVLRVVSFLIRFTQSRMD